MNVYKSWAEFNSLQDFPSPEDTVYMQNDEGDLHCEDGPAVSLGTDPDNVDHENYDFFGEVVQWWFEGKQYNFNEWCVVAGKTQDEINVLKRNWVVG